MGIYVDNSATTKMRVEVLQAMLPYMQEFWGNPSSLHEPGHIADEAIAVAREHIATLIGCQSDEIYFTNSGTLSNNIAILGRARFAEANGQNKHIITTAIEHSAVLGPIKYLEGQGWQVTYLPVDKEGLLSPKELQKALASRPSIISIAWANNEIGSVQPIQELALIAKETGVFFHTDAVQVIGKLSVNLHNLPVSALSISGHKFYAPKGIAVLFVRADTQVMPITFGGGQEQGIFPGTESVANIIGMGKAAQLAHSELAQNSSQLRDLQKTLLERLSCLDNIQLTGPDNLDKRIPGHVSLVAPNRNGESLVLRCDLHGIYLSSGSACHGKNIQPSHVLKAIGLTDEEALGALRMSFGRFNNLDECEEIASVLDDVLRNNDNAIQISLSGTYSQ